MALERQRQLGPLHASEVTRIEILAGMRAGEEEPTYSALWSFVWHPVDPAIAERAGELGRKWLRSHSGIDAADLAIAATADLLRLQLLTMNVRHFPMFEDLRPPY